MARVCVLRHIMGEPADLLFDLDADSPYIGQCDGPPPETWVVGDTDAGFSIDALAALSGVPLHLYPNDAQRNASAAVAPGEPVRWRHTLSGVELKAFMQEMLGSVRRALGSGHVAYYTDVFRSTQGCLGSLERARVDRARLVMHERAEPNQTNLSALASLHPLSDGLAARPIYDQLSTVTGRAIIRSGPRILTLPKRYRDVITSRYDGGRIMSLDYSSLEPRVAMVAVGRTPPPDVYAHISDRVLDGLIPRDKVKVACVALLYGAASRKVGIVSGLRNGDLDRAISAISSYLDIDALQTRLLQQARDSGDVILNHYGRPVRVADRRKLLNYYSQSSAVEAALLGFSGAVGLIREMGWRIHPLFVIHDAMLFDVHPDDAGYLGQVRMRSEQVVGFSVPFPTKLEEV